MSSSSTHHGIDYVEFTVRDLAAAKRFYAAAFGWQFNDYGPEYAGIKGPKGEVGGLQQTAQPVSESRWRRSGSRRR